MDGEELPVVEETRKNGHGDDDSEEEEERVVDNSTELDEDEGDDEEEAEKSKPGTKMAISDGRYRNKQRCLILCSRG